VGTILALAAAILYGSADFLGGAASRRARPVDVLAVTSSAGAVVLVVFALLATVGGLGGHGAVAAAGATGLAWGVAAGAAGVVGLLFFYFGFSIAPMSVVAPVSALASTLLPLGVAIAQGERPGPGVIAGGLICLVAVVLVSMEGGPGGTEDGSESRPSLAYRLRGAGFGLASGVMFGLLFLFFRNAGSSGVLWPVAVARVVGAVLALSVWLLTRRSPGLGLLSPDRPAGALRAVLPLALVSGSADASANVCYVLATRSGLFGIAVVITALYPGMTVLLARFVLGERMRLIQRIGLVLAGAGVVLVAL
jgi:drug/metabolite transporter (DMT)-like permease